jgi:4-hydroxy-2-oxoheptanedioate aldolase
MPIRPNAMRAALREGRSLIGTFAWSVSPAAVEVLGLVGFDYIVFDAEHSSIGLNDLEHLIRAAEARNITAVVRVRDLNAATITGALDSGAAAVIVPQVNSGADAQRAVGGAKYHPLGRRGMAISRAGSYAVGDLPDYYETANRETLLILQVETREAIEHLPSILAVPGFDAVLIGPYDLSQSLGYPGQVDLPAVRGVIEAVIQQCKAVNMPVGMYQRSMEDAKHWRDHGCQLLLVGTDLHFMADAAQAALEEWRK